MFALKDELHLTERHITLTTSAQKSIKVKIPVFHKAKIYFDGLNPSLTVYLTIFSKY